VAGEEEWVCLTTYKGKRILYKLFDGVQTHGSKDKRVYAICDKWPGWFDSIPSQTRFILLHLLMCTIFLNWCGDMNGAPVEKRKDLGYWGTSEAELGPLGSESSSEEHMLC